VLPTVAGKRVDALARPLLDVPELGETLAVAFPDAAKPELELELECEPQPATVKAAAATAAAKTAGLCDMKLDRLIFASTHEFAGVVARRRRGVAAWERHCGGVGVLRWKGTAH